MVTIWWASLDSFWSQEPVTGRGNFSMLIKLVMADKEELGFEDCFPPLCTYPCKEDLGMGVACVNLRLFLRKVRYVGHMQWDSMSKSPITWANLYGYGVL